LERIARSPAEPGMRPDSEGGEYNTFPYSTAPQGLMRPDSEGGEYNTFPYSTGPLGPDAPRF
jgi:hypothetical protein